MDVWAQLRVAQQTSHAARVGDFVDECTRVGLIGDSRSERIRAAVAWLGPTTVPADPVATDALIEQVSRDTEPRDESPVNVAVAVGVGWRRSIDLAAQGKWDGLWERAVFAIADEFQRSLQFTTSLLARLVVDVRIERAEQRSLAELFAIEFVRGCRCGRHRRSCLDPGGHRCCIAQHAIANWDPALAHLSAYVDQAVRGLAESTIRGAAFAEGMLFAELKRTDRLRRANVEGFECVGCGERSESQRCGSTQCTRRPGQMRRVLLMNRLVVPVESGGSHAAERRHVCGACSAIFPIRETVRCPVCDWIPAPGCSPASRQVWVRHASRDRGDR
jgi:hypothetical protein